MPKYTQYQRSQVRTVADIQAISDHAGGHFFSRGAMEFFRSRLVPGVWPGQASHDAAPGSVFFFVTSEQYAPFEGDPLPRFYQVRMVTLGTKRDNRPAVDISTVGGEYRTARDAQQAAAQQAAQHRMVKGE